MLSKSPIKLVPWQKVIIVGPGCEEEIRKAGQQARDLEGEIQQEITVDPKLKNCQEYSVKQERGR